MSSYIGVVIQEGGQRIVRNYLHVICHGIVSGDGDNTSRHLPAIGPSNIGCQSCHPAQQKAYSSRVRSRRVPTHS